MASRAADYADPVTSPAPSRPAAPRSKGWVVGRVAGAPVVVTPSWFVAAVVLTVLFAPTVRAYAPWLGPRIYLVAFAFVLLLFVSVFLHEVAHALMARARGQEVTELAVTIWGGHTAFSDVNRRPLDAFLVAVVGPLTNLALAVGFWVAFQLQPVLTVPTLLLYAGAFSNAFVGLFNLLPGLPLDGGQMLEAAVWRITGSRTRGTVAAGWVGRVVAVAVVAWALLWPLLQGTRPSLVTVAWSALIGAFLWSGAGAAISAGRRREVVEGLSLAALAHRAVPVAHDATVAAAAVASQGAAGAVVVLVLPTGEPVAVVDPAAAGAVPADRAALTPVGAVAVPLARGAVVRADLHGQPLLDAVAAAGRHGNQVVVVDPTGRVVGLLEVSAVVAALRGAGARRPG